MINNSESIKGKFISDLYIDNIKELVQYAYHLRGDWESANDLAQKTFSVLLVKVNEVIVHPKPVGWLYRTLRNIYKQELEKRTRLIEVPLYDEEVMSSYFMQVQGNSESLWEVLPFQLSEDEKQILQWRIGEQLSYYEIANLLGISEIACRQRVSRAIRHCREILSEKIYF